MIFTVGIASQYEPYITEEGANAKKRGRRQGFPGGSVWYSFNEAKKYADPKKDMRVYGVDADWDRDTVRSKLRGADWHDLLIDATLIRIPQQ